MLCFFLGYTSLLSSRHSQDSKEDSGRYDGGAKE